MQKQSLTWLMPVLLAVGAAAALWYYWMQIAEPVEPQTLTAPVARRVEPVPEPVRPVPQPTPRVTRQPDLVPLPPLDQSDDYFKLELTGIFGEALEDTLANSGLIERIVATVDNLPRGQIAERIRPLDNLGGQFAVTGQQDGGEFTIDRDNYARYDELINMVTAADMQQVGDVYRRFYPLFQKSYVDLGYPEGYFNDRLVEVIDHLLATPDIDDSVALVRPHVLYKYADPKLESLSSGQKMMLRMGSEHRAHIKAKLREFRSIATSL